MFSLFAKFRKTRRVRCRDGSEIEVFRDPNAAIPIYVSGIQAEAHASAKMAENVNIAAGGKYREQITGISKLVADQTQNMLMTFRIMYQYYSESPCTRQGYFQDQLSRLLEENARFQRAQLVMQTIVSMTRGRGAPHGEIIILLKEVSLTLSRPAAISELGLELKQATVLVEEWREP